MPPISGGMGIETDIIVTAFTPRFATACKPLFRREGGNVNDPLDRGGATNRGISLRFLVGEGKIDLDDDGFADFDLDMDGDIDARDIRNLSKLDAMWLYNRCFWNRLGCESFPVPLGEAMFDQAVNGGLVAARKLLQRAIVRVTGISLKIDGVVGQTTRDALRIALGNGNAGIVKLMAAYRVAAADRYRAIVAADKTQTRFLAGWLNRAADLGVA